MNIDELFSGIGMVVDDHVFSEGNSDRIVQIVKHFEGRGYPLVKYDSVPKLNAVNLRKLSFILLDWELVTTEDESGFPIQGMQEAQKQAKVELITFIQEILEVCYVPIFIFSNKSNTIKSELKRNKIDIEKDNLPIFIKNKSDITNDGNVKVMEVINNWIDNMPSIYVLKIWDNAIERAKAHTFKQLANSKYWPLVIWQTANTDSVNPNDELLDVLTQNIFGRMQPLSIEQAQLLKVGDVQPAQEEILDILQVQRLDSSPNKESSITGDIYQLEDKKYYLNIRPTCDCIGRKEPQCDSCKKNNCIECPDVNKVYLIKGTALTNAQAKGLFDPKYGNFKEHNNEAIIGPLMKNKFYAFKFQELIVKKYKDVEKYKIGRILPPFIRHITERYALYLQRQALPRIPNQAIGISLESVPTESQEEPG